MEEVAAWLEAIKLPQYVENFKDNGYDDPSIITSLDDVDLEHIGVALPGHRKRILVQAARYSPEEVQRLNQVKASQQQQQQQQQQGKPAAKPRPQPRSRQSESDGKDSRSPNDSLPAVPSATKSSNSNNSNSSPFGRPLSVVNDTPEDVAIQHEGTAVIRPLAITSVVTAKEVIDMFVKATTPMKTDPDNVWTLFETFENPPVERRLRPNEFVLKSKRNWPKTEGCRFLLREMPTRLLGQADSNKTGKLDKRGGRHKSWKSRFFAMQDTKINYYSKLPTSTKQQENPVGAYVFVNHLVYNVKYYKKAPRPHLCFCLRPIKENAPVWPDGDAKEVYDEFDNGCKFICANSEEERADWVASILKRQQDLIDQGAVYGTAEMPMPQSFENDDED
ncbi:hypothetical protein PTSG_04346 [Salpingoeca rosetta]|uniref:SAM domain-containing protein n=1 Tax=Salpingoeca rosetta (strain ATCC 50818 / BSB-021) TaxID=946362 RepID=F2U8A3_SALR5|nr:uncharacterized protein PTSG_04346 [Salpingoeca rosetta]EGD72611.1 hypothetical protein PTSG_04346 [Salpingoeca rosetta]|eukprot:XP_004994434.1 hypothetical protein PTSG_04346 [Salpingoeca rosetta]